MRFKTKTNPPYGGETGVAALRATVFLVDLSKAMNITKFAVKKWKVIPSSRVDEVSQLTGIPKEILRPDMAAKD